MKILVTGAAGYVGSALAKLLISRNIDVCLIDNYYKPSNITELDGISIIKMDIRELRDLSKFDIILNLAAISGISDCENNPSEAFSINSKGVVNLLKNFEGRFIQASTSAVYGQAEHPDIDETHSINPRSVYGQSKYVAENYVEIHTNYCILRFSNIYGKGLMCKRTVADIFIEDALKKLPITIHGDGKQRRDFVHINDVIRAYWIAIHTDICGTYNIGGNEALSINEIAELVCKYYRQIFGYKLEVKHLPIDCGVKWKDFTYSSLKAKNELGYEPDYCVGEEIRARLIAQKRILN